MEGSCQSVVASPIDTFDTDSFVQLYTPNSLTELLLSEILIMPGFEALEGGVGGSLRTPRRVTDINGFVYTVLWITD